MLITLAFNSELRYQLFYINISNVEMVVFEE